MSKQIVDEKGRPITLSSYQKNAIYAKAKNLREEIRGGMCSREECRNPTDRNVQKMIHSEMSKGKQVEIFRKSMEAIGADPKDYNTERFRR